MDLFRWLTNQGGRTVAIVSAVAGLIALLLGWFGVSRSSLPTEQIPYVASGGLLGLFLLGVAGTLWLSADLRDEYRILEEIHQTIQANSQGEGAARQGSILTTPTSTNPSMDLAGPDEPDVPTKVHATGGHAST